MPNDKPNGFPKQLYVVFRNKERKTVETTRLLAQEDVSAMRRHDFPGSDAVYTILTYVLPY